MDERLSNEPHERLTELCAVMTDALDEAREESEEIRCVVFLSDEQGGGLQVHGYPGDTNDEVTAAALADVLVHLQSIFRARGQDMRVIPITKIGHG